MSTRNEGADLPITAEQKINTHRYYLWLLTCQIPKDFWNTPEEAQFFHAQTLTGLTVENTDWDIVYHRIKNECPAVWERSIFLSKKAMGVDV
jgi:hypothetical protein